jgi:hypothetical protein
MGAGRGSRRGSALWVGAVLIVIAAVALVVAASSDSWSLSRSERAQAAAVAACVTDAHARLTHAHLPVPQRLSHYLVVQERRFVPPPSTFRPRADPTGIWIGFLGTNETRAVLHLYLAQTTDTLHPRVVWLAVADHLAGVPRLTQPTREPGRSGLTCAYSQVFAMVSATSGVGILSGETITSAFR